MILELSELIKTYDYEKIREFFAELNVVDIASEFEDMDDRDVAKLFRILPKDTAAEVFAYLSADIQQLIIEAITDREIRDIINELFLDDAVDFIEEMPANVVKRVLLNVPPEKRELINQFLKYPEYSAGSMMTVEYASLRPHTTVADAFERIRNTGYDRETIYTMYVTDLERHLIGVVSAKALLLAEPDDLVDNLMERNFVHATTHEDRESLANSFVKYGLLAMPVVDNENRLVGIITVDDVLEVQQDEATEDFEIMAAMSPSEEPYLKTSVLTLAKNRIIWLLLLMLSATITGAIITNFEEALALLPVLITFIPMLMDTGGNAGSQSSTLVIRGLALEEINTGDKARVLSKEMRVALLCGSILSIVNFARLLIVGDSFTLAAAVSLSLFATVMLAKIVGSLLPIFAKMLRLDPAVMAAPIITTVVDACSLLIYFILAKLILGI